MYKILAIELIFSVIYLVHSQLSKFPVKPERCYGSMELFDRKCCIFPPFFHRDVARSCGAMISVVYLNKPQNVSILRREGATNECRYWKCIMDKYKLMNNEKTVNEEKFYSHLDKWIALNPDFSSIMLSAKIYCRLVYRMYMPLTTCELFDFIRCIRNYVNVDCPKVINSKECAEWKEFFDECKEYYF